jgi:hypothetical protein
MSDLGPVSDDEIVVRVFCLGHNKKLRLRLDDTVTTIIEQTVGDDRGFSNLTLTLACRSRNSTWTKTLVRNFVCLVYVGIGFSLATLDAHCDTQRPFAVNVRVFAVAGACCEVRSLLLCLHDCWRT